MAIVVNKRPYARNWSGNPCEYELYSAAAAADASIYFEVRLMFKFIGGVWTEIVRLPYSPAAGIAVVNLQGLLNSVLQYGLPDLAADETLTYTGPKQTGYFFLSFREVTGDPVGFDESEVDFARFVIKGGISYKDWRGNNFWENYFDPRKPFLTWEKTKRLAAVNERMYLAWLNHTTVTGGDLKARIITYYTDNGATRTQDIALTGAVPDLVSYIPVGCTQLDLVNLEPARSIHYWEVKIMDHTNPGAPEAVSEVFTFELDNRKSYNDTTINYRSSLGGLGSAYARGVIEYNLEFQNEVIEKVTDAQYFEGSQVKAQLQMIENTERTIYKGDLGYLPKEEQDRYRDIHLQRELWWEQDKKWIPIIDVTGNIKQKKSDDKLWSMPIEWTPAIPGDYYYTPKSAAIGDSQPHTNVCAGTIISCVINVTLNVGDADVEFIPTFSAGFTKFTYQILGFHAAPIEVLNVAIPITVNGLNLNQNYTLQLRAVCANGASGKIFNKPFTTAAVVYDSSLYNLGDHYEVFDVYINNVVLHSTNLNIGEWDVFNCGTGGVKDIKVGYSNGLFGVAKLICAAGTFFGTVGVTEATWDDIDITGGFRIEMY
jgi:hypothetical protein